MTAHHQTDLYEIEKTAQTIRWLIVKATTEAGSGHVSSSLSATDLMTTLYFGGFLKCDYQDFSHPNNDRVIFSKGHAAPLFYALHAAAGLISDDEMLTLRKFGSRLEGHPTPAFPFTEVATGSLGQGLSVGVGMALNAKYLDKLSYNTFVLLGDSEMAEGSNWEALQIAAHYKLNNLIGIIDVNRLGQRGETQFGHDLEAYQQRVAAFGWKTITIRGHSYHQIVDAFKQALSARNKNKPVMIIAKTIKGRGVSVLEDTNSWHGKALQPDQLQAAKKDITSMLSSTRAITSLGPIEENRTARVALPTKKYPSPIKRKPVQEIDTDQDYVSPLATRKAYGHSLVELAPHYPELVVLDAEVSNSTFAADFSEAYPDRFFEMFIAEQNMVGAAVGLSKRGKIPFVSTFAAFFSRAMDQIRVAQYSNVNLNFVGSHAGVSIGEDGASQMGLEDIAYFRTLLGSVVLYPADHVSEEQIMKAMIEYPGICYLRTTRADTQALYKPNTEFRIGGSHVLKKSEKDTVTLIGSGITVHESLTAHKELIERGIQTRVIDLYSVKPIDYQTLYQAAEETDALFVIEDHYAEGGIGEAVRTALYAAPTPIYSLAVRNTPKSGSMAEVMKYEQIDASSIVSAVVGLKK